MLPGWHQEVDWIRNTSPSLVAAWEKEKYDAPDSLYFVYDDLQDSVHMRSSYVRDCLVISSMYESEVILLNPNVKTELGEWEAWELSTRNPGAVRYRSFWDLTVARFSCVDAYLAAL